MRSWYALPRHLLRAVLTAAALLLPVLVARAQTTASDVLAQLKDKPLFLRGCWGKDDLSFDHTGKIDFPVAPQSFTLCGIEVDKAALHGDHLEIEGRRIGLEYKDGTASRVRLRWKNYNGKIMLHIAGKEGDDFGPALQAIFAPDLQSLIPSMRDYWKRVGNSFLQDASADEQADDQSEDAETGGEQTPAAAQTPPSITSTGKPSHIGGGVKPPRLLQQTDPSFSEAARGMRYSGKVEVSLWLEPSGRPSHLQVVKPAGLGLDENALAAVASYRFAPATRDGVPVLVDLYVDVNFRIY